MSGQTFPEETEKEDVRKECIAELTRGETAFFLKLRRYVNTYQVK